MASTFTKVRNDLTDDLEAQISRLQKEVASLRKAVSKRGGPLLEDSRDTAMDIYEEVAARIGDALPEIRKQSKAVQRAASDHPVTTAVVGLAVLGLLAGLLIRR